MFLALAWMFDHTRVNDEYSCGVVVLEHSQRGVVVLPDVDIQWVTRSAPGPTDLQTTNGFEDNGENIASHEHCCNLDLAAYSISERDHNATKIAYFNKVP